jgi:hypothetical protein
VKCGCTIFHARWAQCSFHKKHAGTLNAKLVFLHSVGPVGNVVHFGASGARNVDALYFILRWDWYGFNKNRARTLYAELVFLPPVGSTGHVVHSGAFGVRNVDALFFMLGGPGAVSIIMRREMLRRTCVFSSGGICGSRTAFLCVRGMKRRCAIFHARVRLIQIQQKAHWNNLR